MNENNIIEVKKHAENVLLQQHHEPEMVRDIVLRPGQDFIDGQGMYYIVRSQGAPYVIGPDNTMLPVDESREEHIILESPVTTKLEVTPEFMDQIADGTEAINPNDVFAELVNHLKRYIVFKDQRMYTLVATWIIGTYQFRMFPYFAYLNVYGEKNSGKSILLEVLRGLVFNGVITNDATPIAIAELVSQCGATILYDEAEVFGSQRATLIATVLKSGFAHTGQVTRKKDVYSTYSPKVLAAINGLEDVLSDRTLPIRMVRKLPEEVTVHFSQSPSIVNDQQHLREKMYLLGVQYGAKIASEYFNGLSSLVDRIGHLHNRNYDLWAPLLAIASAMESESIVSSLIDLSKEINDQKTMQDIDSNTTGVLINALSAVLSTLRPVKRAGNINYYRPNEVSQQLVTRGAVIEGTSQTAVSKLLHQRLSIGTQPVKIGKHTSRVYAVPDGLIDEYIQRYSKSVS